MAAPPDDASDPVDDFTALFYGSAAKIVGLARFLGAEDPEDVAQEAFCKLYAARDRLRKGDEPHAYLNRIVVNEVRTRARNKATRSKFNPLVAVPSETPGHADDQASRTALMRAVADLPDRQREVVVLRYWLDLPLQAIATATDQRLNTVKSHLSRALKSLRLTGEELR